MERGGSFFAASTTSCVWEGVEERPSCGKREESTSLVEENVRGNYYRLAQGFL